MRHIVAAVLLAAIASAGCSERDKPRPQDNDAVDGWSAAGIGSVFESRTVTRLERPVVHVTETTTRQTLIAINAAEASVKLELGSAGAATTVQEVKVPLKTEELAAHDGSTVTRSEEKCTVPAGTFDCTKTSREVRQGDVTRSTVTWRAKRIPVPIKSVVTNENLTTTTELTRLVLAR